MDTNPPEGQPMTPGAEPIQPQTTMPQNQQPSAKEPEEGLGTASMVLGIIALIIFPVSFVLAVVGLILGIVYKSKGGKKISGIVMNSIALGLNVISMILFVIMVSASINLLGGVISSAIDNGDIEYIYDEINDEDWSYHNDEDDIYYFENEVEERQVQCTAPEGVITLTYDEENLTGSFNFGSLGDFDFDAAKERVGEIGIDNYIEEFIDDFETAHPDGICEKE